MSQHHFIKSTTNMISAPVHHYHEAVAPAGAMSTFPSSDHTRLFTSVATTPMGSWQAKQAGYNWMGDSGGTCQQHPRRSTVMAPQATGAFSSFTPYVGDNYSFPKREPMYSLDQSVPPSVGAWASAVQRSHPSAWQQGRQQAAVSQPQAAWQAIPSNQTGLNLNNQQFNQAPAVPTDAELEAFAKTVDMGYWLGIDSRRLDQNSQQQAKGKPSEASEAPKTLTASQTCVDSSSKTLAASQHCVDSSSKPDACASNPGSVAASATPVASREQSPAVGTPIEANSQSCEVDDGYKYADKARKHCLYPGCSRHKDVFKRSQDLKKHIRTHTKVKPYRCPKPDCKWAFSDPSARKRHMATHDRLRDLTCPKCKKVYRKHRNFVKHNEHCMA